MKKIKQTFSLFAVIFLCISVLVLPASAATATQDHLDVVFTTDQTGYEEKDDISVSLSVTNTGDKAINNVSLQNLLPDGYQLASGSDNSLTSLSLGPGENISLTTVLTAVDSDEDPEEGNSGEDDQKNPGDSGETPLGGNDQGQQSGNSGDNSQKGDNTTPPGGYGSDNVQNSENSTGSVNDNIQESVSAAKAPKTGDFSKIILFLIIIGISAGVVILVARKHKKILSAMLSVVIVGSSVAGLSLSANAADSERKSIEISTDVTILKSSGAENLTLWGLVEYDAPASEEEAVTLKNFESDESYFLCGDESTITFTVDAVGNPDEIELCKNEDESVGLMHDDGLNGDAEANDGTYTFSYTISSKEETEYEYYAIANNTWKSETVTIRFFDTLTIDDYNTFVSVYENIKDIERLYMDTDGKVHDKNIEPCLLAIEEYAKNLKNQELVYQYELCTREGKTVSISIKLESGLEIVFVPNNGEKLSSGKQLAIMSQIKSYVPAEDQSDAEDLLSNSIEMMNNLVDSYVWIKDEEVTLDVFDKMGPNQVILWSGHGVPTNQGTYLEVQESYDKIRFWVYDPVYFVDLAFIQSKMCITSDGCLAVNYKYLKDNLPDLTGSFIYLLSCTSGDDPNLCNTFINKGAVSLVAIHDSINAYYGVAMQSMLGALLTEINPETNNYYTVGEAMSKCYEEFGYNDGKGAYPFVYQSGSLKGNYRLANIQTGTLSGKICKASDQNTAISGAKINVYKGNTLYTSQTADSTGNYSIKLPAGQYDIEITADGYVTFHSYATVVEGEDTQMDTILMVEEASLLSGINGNVVDKDGLSLSGVSVNIFNSRTGENVATTMTDLGGTFSVTLDKGIYNISFSKDGYSTITKEGITVEDGYYQLDTIVMTADTTAASEIWTEEDFAAMNGSSDSYILMQDLDLTDSPRIEFNGTFNGNGHTIRIPFSEKNGMFTTLGEQAVVENCIIDYGSYSSANPPANYYDDDSGYNFGGVALDNNGTISKCEANGSINLSRYYSDQNVMIGTFCVANNGEISYCRSNVNYTIVGHQRAWWYVLSGIGGDPWSEGTIENCLNTGDINATIHNENDYNLLQDILVAGIGTYNMTNCANTGNITLNYQSILMDTADAHTGVGFISPYELYTTGYDLVSDGFPEKLKGQKGSYISEDCILDYTNSTADYDSIRIFEDKTYTAQETENITVRSEEAIMEWWDSINK